MILGLHIVEERPLAGRLACALYITAGVTGLLLLVMPGIEVSDPAVLIACVGAGLLWGVAGLTVVPWRTAPPILSHLSSFAGLPITAVVMADTGGASSPARFYLLFIIFYCSYFYRPREAIFHLLGCIAVVCLPLAYQTGILETGYLAELVVIVPIYIVLSGLIVTARSLQMDLRERADALALTDPLTGVANRRAFEAAMALGDGRGSRPGDRAGLILVDLDDFKAANTLFGHTGGDRVLCAAADALREAARGNDMVARVGGDEFAILANGASREGVGQLADRVLAALARADEMLGLPGFCLSASIGFAAYPEPVHAKADMFECADRALGAAKAAGKHRSRAAVSFAEAPAGQRVLRRPPPAASPSRPRRRSRESRPSSG